GAFASPAPSSFTVNSAIATSSCTSRRIWRSPAGSSCCLPMAPAHGPSTRCARRRRGPPRRYQGTAAALIWPLINSVRHRLSKFTHRGSRTFRPPARLIVLAQSGLTGVPRRNGTRRGAFVHKIQWPGSGKSTYFRNRQTLLVMTASAALLAGIASAEALPFDQQWPTQQPQRLRPAAKPNGLVVVSREKH